LTDVIARRSLAVRVLSPSIHPPLVRPEHAVEMFRVLGGGGFGDTPAGHGPAELAIIPGASHVTVVFQGDLLLKVISRFLDKEVRPAT
jgi:hypothetical protein